ncbi:MAG: hypothetical protein Q9191_007449 [Dirinaria sp. TL-2023a]
MSDASSPSASQPTHAELEQALKNVVHSIYKSGDLGNLTVKRVRKAAEESLDLEGGFFKNDETWKDKSKDIILSEVEAHPDPASSQASPIKKPLPTAPKGTKPQPATNGKKRSSTGETTSTKRRKKDAADAEGSIATGNRRQPKNATARSKDSSPVTHSEQGSPDAEQQQQQHYKKDLSITDGDDKIESESELSEVLDEAPKSKGKRRSTESEKPKPKKAGASKASKPEQPLDPDAEEIKRLQGWLVKCGIRKMWWKELQPYDTPQAKIWHLKGMLSDAGMTGRYSNEKASQIREERELKADLEAVQAGDKQWGKTDSEDAEPGRGKRRLAKGLEKLDFLNDDDGEETD